MKLPSEINKISPDWSSANETIYPPLGFLSFEEHSLGNGDYFGLYWPVGKESEEPIVAEMHHDEWYISPVFSSLTKFLSVAGEEEEWVEPPLLAVDPESPHACVHAAREITISGGNLGEALRLLSVATVRLPEFGFAQWQLSRLHQRLGNFPEAFIAARSSVVAPPCFGGACIEAITWLRRQKSCPSEFSSDPLWNHRAELSFKFGGTKENSEYLVVRKMVNEYRDAGLVIEAILLLQSYGQLMSAETISFRQRYGFDLASHIEEYLNLCAECGLNRRISIAAL